MDYFSHSQTERAEILKSIGIPSFAELIERIIPNNMLLNKKLDIPEGLSEYALSQRFNVLADENAAAVDHLNFVGGGVYDHYIPKAIGHIISRSEFMTAYTPYQAEVSQGTLQTIYEFQSMICRLTGMDVANASHYDGASALAEGVLLALKKTRKNIVIIPEGLNPNYRQVVETYCNPVNIEIRTAKTVGGLIDADDLAENMDGVGAVVVQQPNFYGLFESAEIISAIAHSANALLVASVYPTSLGILKSPGEWGADIVTGEGQSLGVSMSLGGPFVGLFAARQDLVRMIPGRLVARAQDKNDKDGFVLTLQTREQHIRREKATSNICTNQALVALNALVYLSLLGRNGLQRAALNSYRSAHYLADKLTKLKGCGLHFSGEFFNEFVLELPCPATDLQDRLLDHGIYVGPALGIWDADKKNCVLIAVTEKQSRDDLDRFAEIVGKVLTK